MNDDLRYALAMITLVPSVIGLYKFKRVSTSIHPFIIMIWLDAIMETITYLCIKLPANPQIQPVAVNSYMLLNFLLFLYLVYRNEYLQKTSCLALSLIAIAVFTGSAVFNKTISVTFWYLLCFVSFAMLLLSIDILSKQIMSVKQKWSGNFWFWMSATSILYNAQVLLIFGLYFFALFNTKTGKSIGNIQTFTNAVCYIFFTIALLKAPPGSKIKQAH